jgi:hypothetical protein
LRLRELEATGPRIGRDGSHPSRPAEAATALGWYSFSRSITAQAMRAVLFASATATTSGGRRRRKPITHGSALVAFDRSRLALAPLMSSRRK